MDLKQGDLENIILNALWDLERDGAEKIFVGNIQEKIRSPHKKWAYTTVKTVLDRLVDKDIAFREKDGKKYLYRSVVDRDKAGLVAVRKVVRQYFRNDINLLITCLQQMQLHDGNNAPFDGKTDTPEDLHRLEVERLAAKQQLQAIRDTHHTDLSAVPVANAFSQS